MPDVSHNEHDALEEGPLSVDDLIAEATYRTSDPNTWPPAELAQALADGWIAKVAR